MAVTAAMAAARPALTGFGDALGRAIDDIKITTDALFAARDAGKVNLALANASVYLDMLGHAVIAWMWLRQALIADASKDGPEKDFYEGKLAACRYFFHWELPKTHAQGELLRSLDSTCLDVRNEYF
jgi:hypothetical protein